MSEEKSWKPKKCHKCGSIELRLIESLEGYFYMYQGDSGLMYSSDSVHHMGNLTANCLSCNHTWKMRGKHHSFIEEGKIKYNKDERK